MKFFRKIRLFLFLIPSIFSVVTLNAQINAEQVLTIGKNVLSMEDYMLAIQYFNLAIKAKPYLADPYYYRAIAKLNLEDYKGAEEDCTIAIEKNYFKTDAYKLRGFVRQLMDMDSLAITDYDKGLAYNPQDKYFLFYKAIALTELNDTLQADSTFSILIRQYPNFDDAFSARGRLDLIRGDTVRALQDIDRAIAITKTKIQPFLMKAEINWKRKNWPEAAENINSAIKLSPDAPDLYVNRAFISYNSDDFTSAMQDYNHALLLDSTNIPALFNRALLRYEVKDLTRAEKDLSRVLELDPQNFHALYNRGLVRLEQENFKDALSDFNSIAARYPRFYPVYYAIGETQRSMGHLREAGQAIRYADQLVEGYIKDPEKNVLDRPTIASAETTNARRWDGEDESAEEVMDKFNQLVTVSKIDEQQMTFNDKIKGRVQDRNVKIDIQPAFAVSIFQGPESLQSQSNYFKELDNLNNLHLLPFNFYLTSGLNSADYADQTNELFAQVSRLNNAGFSKKRPIDYLALGVIYTMLRDYKNALGSLDNAVESDSRFTLALMARGYARLSNALAELKLGKENKDETDAFLEQKAVSMLLQEAVNDFNSAIYLNPNLIYAKFNIGVIYYFTGDYNQALQYFSDAIKGDPAFAQSYFNRGLTYLQTGNKAKAFADLSKAGELGILESYNILKRMQ